MKPENTTLETALELIAAKSSKGGKARKSPAKKSPGKKKQAKATEAATEDA